MEHVNVSKDMPEATVQNVILAHLAGQKKFWGALFLVLIAWGCLFHEALLSAARIWYISEIFSHGFFVVPGAAYLIWRERERLKSEVPQSNFWVLLLIVPALLLGVMGRIGGIEVITHISAFTVLPLTAWFLFGNRIAAIIWFPLLFVLFSIPIGEELVPSLQRITADLAVAMLGLTSIPVYSTGLYIDIPQGKFLVAEACSGIRFFIGSLVFGAIYSHLSYHTLRAKALFMLAAALVPILANAARVFGIVVIGYWSDMEYAAGADHLIYGWVFFAIVLFLLIIIGEVFRHKSVAPSGKDNASVESEYGGALSGGGHRFYRAIWLVFVLFAITFVWQMRVSSPEMAAITDIRFEAPSDHYHAVYAPTSWKPVFEGSDRELFLTLEHASSSLPFELFMASYGGRTDGELISSSNAFFDKERWSLSATMPMQVVTSEGTIDYKVLDISSNRDERRLVAYWYVIPRAASSSPMKIKLFQAFDLLLGGSGDGGVVAVSLAYTGSEQEKGQSELAMFVKQHGSRLSSLFRFN